MVHPNLTPAFSRDRKFSNSTLGAGTDLAQDTSVGELLQSPYNLQYGMGVLGVDFCYPTSTSQLTDSWITLNGVGDTVIKTLECPSSFGTPSAVLVDFFAFEAPTGPPPSLVSFDTGVLGNGKVMSLLVNVDYTKSSSMQTVVQSNDPISLPTVVSVTWMDTLGKTYSELGGYILGVYGASNTIAWQNPYGTNMSAYIEGAWLDNSSGSCVVNIKFTSLSAGTQTPATKFRAIIKKVPTF